MLGSQEPSGLSHMVSGPERPKQQKDLFVQVQDPNVTFSHLKAPCMHRSVPVGLPAGAPGGLSLAPRFPGHR